MSRLREVPAPVIRLPRADTEVLATNFWFGSPLADSFTAGALELERQYAPWMNISRMHADCHVAGGVEHGINHYTDYFAAFRRLRDHLSACGPRHVINLGGGCAAAIAILPYLHSVHPGMRVIWIDAHYDLNLPPTSRSHYIHGMSAGILTDPDWYGCFFEDSWWFDPAEFLFYGQKMADPYEREFLDGHSITRIPAGGDANVSANAVLDDLKGLPVYVHLDLDVLRPEVFPNPKCRLPDGLGFDELSAFIAAVRQRSEVVGYTIAENPVSDPDGVRRVVGLFLGTLEPGES